MAIFYLIRHGETDYEPVESRGFIGHGRDLAPLTALGVRQLERTARDPRLQGCGRLLCSPYTRAMQSAAIVSRRLDIPLTVEVELHEWLHDTAFQAQTMDRITPLCEDFLACRGAWPHGEKRPWEQIADLQRRLAGVMARYQGEERVIVVCHAMLIHSLANPPAAGLPLRWEVAGGRFDGEPFSMAGDLRNGEIVEIYTESTQEGPEERPC